MILQKALSSYEDRPKAIITKQSFTEGLYIIRDKDRGSPAWYYILVPADKVVDLKAHMSHATLDITNFGRVIDYRNHRNKVLQACGWGTDPPKMFQTWINEQYGK
jgi:hypothetical protein